MPQAAGLRGIPTIEKAYSVRAGRFSLEAIVRIIKSAGELGLQAGCAAFFQKMYRQALDVSSKPCRLHCYKGFVRSRLLLTTVPFFFNRE